MAVGGRRQSSIHRGCDRQAARDSSYQVQKIAGSENAEMRQRQGLANGNAAKRQCKTVGSKVANV